MKISHPLCILCAVLLAAIPLRTVHAITIQLEFVASHFEPNTSGGSAAPQETVSGSIQYEALSTTSTIDSINEIDLTIVDHTYLVGDVGYVHRVNQPNQCIGDGAWNGFCNVGAINNDFMLRWHQASLLPAFFAYSTGSGETWGTSTFDSFSITAIPIPPTLLLFVSGLLGLITLARKKV